MVRHENSASFRLALFPPGGCPVRAAGLCQRADGMSTPQQDFQKFLDLQRSDYARALPEKMAQVHALWRAVTADGEAAQPLTELERLVHTLAGTAGTLGFHEVGRAAKALELLLQQVGPAGPALAPAQRSAIGLTIAALQASLPPVN